MPSEEELLTDWTVGAEPSMTSVAVTGEGITAVNGGESESGVVASGVLDGAAVEGEGGGGFVVEIGGGIAVLDGVCKGESAGAGS